MRNQYWVYNDTQNWNRSLKSMVKRIHYGKDGFKNHAKIYIVTGSPNNVIQRSWAVILSVYKNAILKLGLSPILVSNTNNKRIFKKWFIVVQILAILLILITCLIQYAPSRRMYVVHALLSFLRPPERIYRTGYVFATRAQEIGLSCTLHNCKLSYTQVINSL